MKFNHFLELIIKDLLKNQSKKIIKINNFLIKSNEKFHYFRFF